MTFETREPLDEIAERLDRHGYADAQIAQENFGSVLSVTDPDGRPCQVHQPAPEA